MFDGPFTIDMLTTFTGLTGAVMLIVQFSKSLVKNKFGDAYVRLYSFIIALILIFIFQRTGNSPQDIALVVINAIIVTVTSAGGYDMITDPKATRKRDKGQ